MRLSLRTCGWPSRSGKTGRLPVRGREPWKSKRKGRTMAKTYSYLRKSEAECFMASVSCYATFNHGLCVYALSHTYSTCCGPYFVQYNAHNSIILILVYPSSCVGTVRPGAADALKPSGLLCIEGSVGAAEGGKLPGSEYTCFAPEFTSQPSA